jgi:hypothetical protein
MPAVTYLAKSLCQYWPRDNACILTKGFKIMSWISEHTAYFKEREAEGLKNIGLAPDFDFRNFLIANGGLGIDKNGRAVMSKRLKAALKKEQIKHAISMLAPTPTS